MNELPAKEVKITYVTAGQDDELLKQAILQLVNTYYDNRSDFNVMQGVSFVEVPSNVEINFDSKNVYLMITANLDTRINVRRHTKTDDGFGGNTSSITTVKTIWANKKEKSGDFVTRDGRQKRRLKLN